MRWKSSRRQVDEFFDGIRFENSYTSDNETNLHSNLDEKLGARLYCLNS